MKMKRIMGAVIFLFGLLVLVAVASFVFVPRDNTEEAGMEEVRANGILGEKENTIDILVLGDSESYAAISPLQLWQEKGYTAYVSGTSTQRLTYSYTMLRRAFQKQKPKLVILETLAIYRNVTLNNVVLSEVTRYLPIFQYHDRWKSFNFNGFGSEIKYSRTEDYKGYYYSKEIAPAEAVEYMIPTDETAQVSKTNKKYMQRIKDFCDENGAELVLVSAPSTVNWDYQSHNGIQVLANELGCDYIDLNLENDVINIDWNLDTLDNGDHMNYTGAIKVTDYLGEYLSKKGILTDHRGDENYESWNECLDKLKLEAEGIQPN